MREVTIPCHPLSRRVLLAEYGSAPIMMDKKQELYETLLGYTVGSVTTRNLEQFTSSITLLLPPDVASHVEAKPHQAAERLYRADKKKLTWYVFAQVRALGKGAARPAVADWLDLYKVEEDEYSLETAYKLFQRKGWDFDKKNPLFSAHLRTKSAAYVGGKRRRKQRVSPALTPLTWLPPDQVVELAASRFLAAYIEQFSRLPKTMPRHARFYIYCSLQGISRRSLAKKMNQPYETVRDAISSMRGRMMKNPAVKRLMDEICALPQAEAFPTP